MAHFASGIEQVIMFWILVEEKKVLTSLPVSKRKRKCWSHTVSFKGMPLITWVIPMRSYLLKVPSAHSNTNLEPIILVKYLWPKQYTTIYKVYTTLYLKKNFLTLYKEVKPIFFVKLCSTFLWITILHPRRKLGNSGNKQSL